MQARSWLRIASVGRAVLLRRMSPVLADFVAEVADERGQLRLAASSSLKLLAPLERWL
jgi:hypothetical protein